MKLCSACFLLLFLSLYNVSISYAQESGVYYEHFTVNDGLPTQGIYTLLQDKRGFLWIATEAGVSCYDGRNFTNFTTEDGLGDNEVLDIFEDRRGRIWFIPFSGRVSYYHFGKFHNPENNLILKELPSKSFQSPPVEDIHGNLYSVWNGAPSKLVVLNPEDQIKIIDLQELLGYQDAIRVVYRSTDYRKVYCVLQHSGVLVLEGNSFSVLPFNAESIWNNRNLKYFVNSQYPEKVLLTDQGNVYKLSDTAVTFLFRDEVNLADVTKPIMKMDQYGHVWVSHFIRNTLFYRSSDTGYLPPVSLLKERFSIIAFDHENNVWFCTSSQGLYKLAFSKLLHDPTFHLNQQLLQKNALCIHSAKDGTLWIGYSNGYLTRISGQEITHYKVNLKDYTHNRVLQIGSDEEGNIWCGTDQSCFLLRKLPRGNYGMPELCRSPGGQPLDISVKSIVNNPDGSLAITSSRSLFLIRKNEKEVVQEPPFNALHERLYSSYMDSLGIRYVSSISGLLCTKDGQLLHLYQNDPQLRTRIQHFAQNSSGTLFLATYNDGLLALEDGVAAARLNAYNGLAGTICRRVFCLNDTLYIATNRGITIAIYHNQSFRVLMNLGTVNGLPSTDINDLAFQNQVMYVATSEGISAISLPVIPFVTVPAPVLNILSFAVNSENQDPGRELVLPYKRQSINIRFIAPVMDRPETVRYRYRFKNRQDEWQMLHSGQLEFNDLPHGTYHLEIQAKKYNSAWSNPESLLFTITPPFYLTWWFRATVAVLLGLALYAGVRIRLTRKFNVKFAELTHKEAIEKERNRIAADIHDDMGAELSNIVILTRILKKQHSDSKSPWNIFEKLEQSANELISKMNEVVWTLNATDDTLHNLTAYLRSYSANFLDEHHVKTSIQIDNEAYSAIRVSAETKRNVFLILKEALHNLVKHSKAREASVSIRFADNSLELEVFDNGVGFRKDQVSDGNGLTNIRKRAEAIGGKVEILSWPDEGTKICISIPINRSNI